MKVLQIAGALVALILSVYAVLLIGQIWDHWMEWSTFIKLSITAAVLVAVIGIVAMIWHESAKEREMKKEKYLD